MLNYLRLGFAVLVLGTLPTALIAGEVPKSIKDAGKLTLSINATYPPMEYIDPDTHAFKGLDIDLVDAIAAKLGLKVERTDGLFNQLIPALTTGRSDFILSGMTDTAERRESMDFVNYMRAGAQFYVLTASKINDPVQLCGLKVGTVRSASYPGLIKQWSDKNCVGAGLQPIEVVGAESSPDVRLQLKQGRVEAAVQGGETIPFTSAQDGGNVYRVIGEPINIAYYGAAFRKEDSAFRDAVADTIDELIADGTYAKIFAKWELTSHALPKVLINSEQRH